jgi:hypothetical protein
MNYLVTQFSAQLVPRALNASPQPPDPPFPAYPAPPTPPANPQTISDLLQEADVQDVLRELGGQELDAIADWLAQLFLLKNVPFGTLVPAASMLPPESVRFFYVDVNWLAALLEGALSIGIESSLDRLYQDLMKDLIWDTVTKLVQQVRDKLLAALSSSTVPGSTVPYDELALTGMLLRSSVVSGWPGLQVNGYGQSKSESAEPDVSTSIGMLRMDRLSSDVMLCLWPSIPEVVTIDEPHEGVAFGFEEPGTGTGNYVSLRSLDPENYGVLDNQYLDATPFIGQDRRLAITGKDGLVAALGGKFTGKSISASEFAVEMIKTPGRAIFAASKPAGQRGGE